MTVFTIRATKDGKPRETTAETREQAEIIAETWWRFLWRDITIDDVPWSQHP